MAQAQAVHNKAVQVLKTEHMRLKEAEVQAEVRRTRPRAALTSNNVMFTHQEP